MDKQKRIYFHKEDVWSQGNHWMTSASRDIFEHFYKSIKATFKNQFTDPCIQELIEKIQNIRNWESELFRSYSEAAQSKNLVVQIKAYKDQRAPLPEESEYAEKKIVPKDQMDYDKKIYPDFETFFKEADHGWVKNDDGKQTCFDLYSIFIKDISIEVLKEQMEYELTEAKKWENRLDEALINFMKHRSELTWHQFLIKNLKD